MTSCDLPMPASPDSRTTWPSPAAETFQVWMSKSHSSSRPTKGVTPRAVASKRLTDRPPTTWYKGIGLSKPLTGRAPKSWYSNRSAANCLVRPDTTIELGDANACSRAARFAASPTTASCSVTPSVLTSPTTTKPVAIPILTCRAKSRESPSLWLRGDKDLMISRLVWMARAASSSCAIGISKKTRIPSPRYLETWPPYCLMGPRQVDRYATINSLRSSGSSRVDRPTE